MDITITQLTVTPALGVDDLVPTPGAADPAATAQFSDLMEAPYAHAASDETMAIHGTAEIKSGRRTLGDNILGGLQHISADLQQTWHQVGAALNGSNALGVRDLLKMQMGLASMSVQYELVGKAVSRSTQNVDQLVKLQ